MIIKFGPYVPLIDKNVYVPQLIKMYMYPLLRKVWVTIEKNSNWPTLLRDLPPYSPYLFFMSKDAFFQLKTLIDLLRFVIYLPTYFSCLKMRFFFFFNWRITLSKVNYSFLPKIYYPIRLLKIQIYCSDSLLES